MNILGMLAGQQCRKLFGAPSKIFLLDLLLIGTLVYNIFFHIYLKLNK